MKKRLVIIVASDSKGLLFLLSVKEEKHLSFLLSFKDKLDYKSKLKKKLDLILDFKKSIFSPT